MIVPLDPVLLDQLENQINNLDIKQALKNSLLNKVVRLKNLAGITRSLDSMTQMVERKGEKGKVPDTDVQSILNLLEQIQNML